MYTYQLFLGHNDQSRLEFYKQYIDLPREYQNAETVAKLRGVSTTSVYRMIQIIGDELNELRVSKGAAPVAHTEPISRRFNIPAPCYAVYLMRQSIVGEFLCAVMQHPDWTVKEFADAQGTSTATVFRRTKALSEMLKQYDLRLNYNPISINGNEMVVRITLSEILWQICQDGVDLFPELGDLPEQTALRLEKAQLVMPNFNHRRLRLICAVNIIRANSKHPLNSLRPLDEIITITGFKPALNHMPDFVSDFPNTIALIHLETMLCAGFHTHDDELLSRFIGYHARLNTADWQLVSLIQRRMHTVAGVNAHMLDNQVLVGNILSVTVAMNILGVGVPVLEPVVVPVGSASPSSLENMLKQIFATLPGHLQGFRKIQTPLTRRITPLLATALPDAKRHVRIYIDETMDHQEYAAIEASLTQMPAVQLVHSESVARLIITADMTKVSDPRVDKSKYFYFSISSYSSWLSLEHYIHYLAVHEKGIKTGSGIDYTYIDEDLAVAED